MSDAAVQTASPIRVPEESAVIRALTWRFFRHGWRTILPPLLIICGVPTLLFVMIRIADAVVINNLFAASEPLRRIYFLMTLATLPTLVLFEAMRVRQLYTLPIPTLQLVHVQLGLGILSVVGLQLIATVYFRLMFEAPIPFIGPLLFLVPGFVIAAGLGALLVDARLWRFLIAIMASGGLGYAGIVRFDTPRLQESADAWFTPSRPGMAMLTAMAAVGYGIVLHTAIRDRQGELRSWLILEEYFHRFITWVTAHRPSRLPSLAMTTPAAAQIAIEWRTKGLALPIVALAFGSLSLIAAYHEPHIWFQSYMMAIPIVLMFGMVFNGYFVGLMDGPDVKGPMDRFRATRPLSDWQLATVSLKNGLVSTLVAFVITIALACLVYLYACLCGYSHGQIWRGLFDASAIWFRAGVLSYVGSLATVALLGWAGMGFNISCISSGRHWLVVWLWLGGIGLMLVNILLQKLLPAEAYEQVMQTALIVTSVVAVTATLFSFQRATARGLIPRGTIPAAAALGVLAAILSYAMVHHQFDPSGTFFLVLLGVGALVALPLASVPLAIAWNRHR